MKRKYDAENVKNKINYVPICQNSPFKKNYIQRLARASGNSEWKSVNETPFPERSPVEKRSRSCLLYRVVVSLPREASCCCLYFPVSPFETTCGKHVQSVWFVPSTLRRVRYRRSPVENDHVLRYGFHPFIGDFSLYIKF